MAMMTLADRAAAYREKFRKWPASWPWMVSEQGRDVLYGIWVIGNDYRNKSALYGAYPRGYLDRVFALYPDVEPRLTLHVFSGSLANDATTRLDINPLRSPDVQGSVYDAASLLETRMRSVGGKFCLVLADPPYSAADAERYGTKAVNRRRALAALADVTAPGRHLAWLDTCWPMFSKRQWLTVGRILVQRSTNHRARVLTLFERQP